METKKERNMGKQLLNWILCFLIIGIITMTCNVLGYDVGVKESIPGILIIVIIAVVGMVLGQLFPKIPGTLWIMIVSMLCGAPFFPFSEQIILITSKIQLSAIVPPILAYAGVSIGKDWASFKRLGWRAVIVGCIAMLGTFLFSGLIAEVMMRF